MTCGVALGACSASEDAVPSTTTSAPVSTPLPATPAPTPVTAPEPPTPTSTTSPTTTTVPAPATTTSTTVPGPPTTPALGAAETPRVVPVASDAGPGWGTTHAEYPATDVFAACGTPVLSPVTGTVVHVRRDDMWDSVVDNPATRGGRSVAVVGADGVRYYMAHLDTIDTTLEPGVAVVAGQPVATLGRTGRASACHLHFALSVPCPGPEWSVRRGVIWPYPYLDAWRDGVPSSPVEELQQWAAENPDACAVAMADPDASAAG